MFFGQDEMKTLSFAPSANSFILIVDHRHFQDVLFLHGARTVFLEVESVVFVITAAWTRTTVDAPLQWWGAGTY